MPRISEIAGYPQFEFKPLPEPSADPDAGRLAPVRGAAPYRSGRGNEAARLRLRAACVSLTPSLTRAIGIARAGTADHQAP